MRWFAHAVGFALIAMATIQAKSRQAELDYQANEVPEAPPSSSGSLLGRLASGLMGKLKSSRTGTPSDYAESQSSQSGLMGLAGGLSSLSQNSGLLSKLTSGVLGTPHGDEPHQSGRQVYGNNGYFSSWSNDHNGNLNLLESIEQMLNQIALPYLNALGYPANAFLSVIQRAVSYLYAITNTMAVTNNVITPLVHIASRIG